MLMLTERQALALAHDRQRDLRARSAAKRIFDAAAAQVPTRRRVPRPFLARIPLQRRADRSSTATVTGRPTLCCA